MGRRSSSRSPPRPSRRRSPTPTDNYRRHSSRRRSRSRSRGRRSRSRSPRGYEDGYKGKRDTEEKIVADEVIRRTEAEISKRVHAALESEEFLQELQVRIDTAKKELTEKMLAEIKKELQEQKANILEEARNQTKDSKIISNSNGTQSKSLPPPPPTQSSSQLSRSTPQPPNVPPPPPPPPPPSAPSRSSALVPDHNPGDVEMEVDHEEEERLNRLRELEEKARLQQEQMKREQEEDERRKKEQQLILGKGTNSKDKTRAKLSFGLMKK